MELTESWTRTELAEVTRLLNEASPFDRFSAGHVLEAIFDDPNFDPELLLCSRVDGELTGVVAAVARDWRDGSPELFGYVKLLAVAPRWQGRGQGSVLLAEVERRALARGAATMQLFGDAPSYLRPGVDFRLTRLVCLLLRRSYAPVGHAVNMSVDLAGTSLDTTADERRLIGADIEIRRLASFDTEAVAAYLLGQWGWDWQVETMRCLAHVPISCHLALNHGEIVGFAAYDSSGPGQFGPMGVRPDLRQYGIGGVLLKRCLADLRDAGYRSADIQWVGPIPFYARHVNATLSQCFWQMRKTLGPA